MKKFWLGIVICMVITAVSVLLVPGVDDAVEGIFQMLVGRAAR